jgi:RHS repeat-associated protein
MRMATSRMTASGLFEWDGENRLAAVKRKADGALVATYTYDDQGRRVRKISTAIAAQGTSDTVFAWDGWNMIGEMDYDTWTYNPIRFYTWGLDLSGTTHGAGGVGGLLMEQDSGTAATYFTSYDGNGNLVNMVNAANGTIAAEYEYGPFGEPLRAAGTMAESNPFRFSTKYQDQESGLLYYGFRYYNPGSGRWISMDPVGDFAFRGLIEDRIGDRKKLSLDEEALMPAYLFARNGPTQNIDMFGLKTCTPCKSATWIISAKGGAGALGAGGGYFYGTATCAGESSNSFPQHIACGALGLGLAFGSFNATVENTCCKEALSGMQFAGSGAISIGWGKISIGLSGGNISGAMIVYGSPLSGMWIPCTLQ